MPGNDDLPPMPDSQPDPLIERPSRARYDRVRHGLDRKWRRRTLNAPRMMREVVDALWDNFGGSPYSWCGFYVLSPSGDRLVLGPCRDKPACSPIELHGVCGKVVKGREAVVVEDVKVLAGDYIECHPEAVSEIAVPVFDKDDKVWGVLDVDSAARGAFSEMDRRWLERILKPFSEIRRPD